MANGVEAALKRMLKQALVTIPPIRRRIRELDQLRADVSRLSLLNRAVSEELDRIKAAYEVAQRKGLWVPPGHFYSPIPAIQELKANEEEIFDIPCAVRGVALHHDKQLALLEEFCGFYAAQPFVETKAEDRRYFFENPNYSYTDAIVLYCMMRHLQPRRIVEVGSGYSSCAMLDVNELFFDQSIYTTFIDPYPQLLRSVIRESDKERSRII